MWYISIQSNNSINSITSKLQSTHFNESKVVKFGVSALIHFSSTLKKISTTNWKHIEQMLRKKKGKGAKHKWPFTADRESDPS